VLEKVPRWVQEKSLPLKTLLSFLEPKMLCLIFSESRKKNIWKITKILLSSKYHRMKHFPFVELVYATDPYQMKMNLFSLMYKILFSDDNIAVCRPCGTYILSDALLITFITIHLGLAYFYHGVLRVLIFHTSLIQNGQKSYPIWTSSKHLQVFILFYLIGKYGV
jgi:hypothetical protein